MQTDVAHGAKHYEVVFSVVTISANLALRILYLSLPLFLLYDGLAVAGLLQVHLLLLLLHVVEEYFFVCVNLVNQLKGIVLGMGMNGLVITGSLGASMEAFRIDIMLSMGRCKIASSRTSSSPYYFVVVTSSYDLILSSS